MLSSQNHTDNSCWQLHEHVSRVHPHLFEQHLIVVHNRSIPQANCVDMEMCLDLDWNKEYRAYKKIQDMHEDYQKVATVEYLTLSLSGEKKQLTSLQDIEKELDETSEMVYSKLVPFDADNEKNVWTPPKPPDDPFIKYLDEDLAIRLPLIEAQASQLTPFDCESDQ